MVKIVIKSGARTTINMHIDGHRWRLMKDHSGNNGSNNSIVVAETNGNTENDSIYLNGRLVIARPAGVRRPRGLRRRNRLRGNANNGNQSANTRNIVSSSAAPAITNNNSDNITIKTPLEITNSPATNSSLPQPITTSFSSISHLTTTNITNFNTFPLLTTKNYNNFPLQTTNQSSFSHPTIDSKNTGVVIQPINMNSKAYLTTTTTSNTPPATTKNSNSKIFSHSATNSVSSFSKLNTTNFKSFPPMTRNYDNFPPPTTANLTHLNSSDSFWPLATANRNSSFPHRPIYGHNPFYNTSTVFQPMNINSDPSPITSTTKTPHATINNSLAHNFSNNCFSQSTFSNFPPLTFSNFNTYQPLTTPNSNRVPQPVINKNNSGTLAQPITIKSEPESDD